MSDSIAPDNVSNTLRAATSVVGLLPRLAGLVAGLTGIALFTGWGEARSYYSALGAPWVAAMLAPTRFIQLSLGPISVIALLTLLSVYWLTVDTTAATHLRRSSIALLFVSAVLYIVGAAQPHWLSLSTVYICIITGAYLAAVATGLTVGEIIAGLAERELKWNAYHLWLLHFIVVVSMILAPQQIGFARAQLDGDLQSSKLPVVSTTTAVPGRVWKLVDTFEGSFLVVALASKPEDRVFRVLSANDITEIRSRM